MVFITEIPSDELDISISIMPDKNEYIYDLSKQKINHLPLNIINLCQHIKQLYLESNALTELPDEFYSNLLNLEYLDLRNNKLKKISKNICKLKNLEILLLESNRIEQLPIELSLLENLKGLQLANNPLIYPARSIINQGLSAIFDFLKKEAISSGICEEKKGIKSKKSLVKNFKLHWKKEKKIINPFERKKRRTKKVNMSEMSKINSLRVERYFNNVEIPTIKDIIDETMRDLSLRKLRFIFEKQERILQKHRDIEAIKCWRWKYTQIAPLKTEGKYVNTSIFNRNDDTYLNKMKRKKAVVFRENCPKNREALNKAMTEVTDKLTNLNLHEPGFKDRQALANYMKKVEELQDRLKVLRIINTQHL